MSLSSILRQEIIVALIIAAVLGVLVLWLRPADRASTRNALAVVALCVLAETTRLPSPRAGMEQTSGIVADVTAIVVGIVLIRLAGMLVFRVLLPVLRMTATAGRVPIAHTTEFLLSDLYVTCNATTYPVCLSDRTRVQHLGIAAPSGVRYAGRGYQPASVLAFPSAG